jgi:hypothetical protein
VGHGTESGTAGMIVDGFLPIHEAQLITDLRLGASPVGLMINFNVRKLKEGIVRRVV